MAVRPLSSSRERTNTVRATRDARRVMAALCTATVLLAAGCSRGDTEPVVERSPVVPRQAAARPADSDAPRVVFLGDSLTAGLGVAPEQAYPALVQQRLRAGGYPHEVVNAGVSGDTSAGGLRRLDWSLAGRVEVLVVALGANDGLRGLAPADLEKNLATIVGRTRGRGIPVLLAGMEAPPNFGATYTRQFRAVYPSLAQAQHVPLIPFLLAGVAGVPALNQADGIHPNPEGHRLVADLVWRQLEPMLAPRPTQ